MIAGGGFTGRRVSEQQLLFNSCPAGSCRCQRARRRLYADAGPCVRGSTAFRHVRAAPVHRERRQRSLWTRHVCSDLMILCPLQGSPPYPPRPPPTLSACRLNDRPSLLPAPSHKQSRRSTEADERTNMRQGVQNPERTCGS